MNRTALWIAIAGFSAWLLMRSRDSAELVPGTVYVTGSNLFMRGAFIAAMAANDVPYVVATEQYLAEVTGDADFIGTAAGMMVHGYTVNWVGIIEGFEVAAGDDALAVLIAQAVAQSREIRA